MAGLAARERDRDPPGPGEEEGEHDEGDQLPVVDQLVPRAVRGHDPSLSLAVVPDNGDRPGSGDDAMTRP
jgi:hypothetical protein